jgi:hypothetical protein
MGFGRIPGFLKTSGIFWRLEDFGHVVSQAVWNGFPSGYA